MHDALNFASKSFHPVVCCSTHFFLQNTIIGFFHLKRYFCHNRLHQLETTIQMSQKCGVGSPSVQVFNVTLNLWWCIKTWLRGSFPVESKANIKDYILTKGLSLTTYRNNGRASVLPRPRNYRVRRGFHDNLARFFRVQICK